MPLASTLNAQCFIPACILNHMVARQCLTPVHTAQNQPYYLYHAVPHTSKSPDFGDSFCTFGVGTAQVCTVEGSTEGSTGDSTEGSTRRSSGREYMRKGVQEGGSTRRSAGVSTPGSKGGGTPGSTGGGTRPISPQCFRGLFLAFPYR